MNIFIDDSAGGVQPVNPASFSSVKLLCHFDGSNGSSTLTDSSSFARTATRNGNAQITTTGPVFGTGAGLFDGTGDNWSFPNSTDFDFGTGAFTIEGRVLTNTTSGLKWILSTRAASGNDNGFYVAMNGGGLVFHSWNNGSGGNDISNSAPISTSTWYSFAITSNGTTLRFFQNGVLANSASVVAIGNTNGLLYVGSSSGEDGSRDWNGKMDEIRIIKGECLYTANYTPATVAFPDS